MGQVRQDILNGWKEIGGYVCRDIRTVERWEKQRGLPVRRVPGAGRATVYALTSELDHWLESSKLDARETVGGELAGETFSSSTAASPDVGTDAKSAPSPYLDSALSSAQDVSTSQETNPPAWSFSFRTRPESEILSKPILGRQKWVAVTTTTIAAGLLCLFASPILRSHANPTVGPASYNFGAPGDSSGAPYHSQIAGVDDLYLRGIYFYEQRTPESLRRSRDDFSAAIKKDPNYAPAYAGLANTYNLLREYSVMPDAEAYPKATEAAEHAVALDPRLPQAHASLGFIDFFWSWDTVSAEREFKTALALDPSSVLAHHWYGSMLLHEGRYGEAVEQLNIAQRLQPTSAAILSTRALAMGLSGHRGEAMDLLQDLVNETPGVSSPHAILATLSSMQPRDPARYLDEMRRVAELRHSDEMLRVAAAAETAYRSGGEPAMWLAILSAEEQLHPGAANRSYLMADAEAALGRNDAAIADLTRLAQRRDPQVIGVVIDPTLSALHGDRRFGQVVASIGLPPVSH